MRVADVKQYLAETAGVEGWFFPVDAYLFGFFDTVQQANGIAGNLFEIGVHHGKTALLLARMLRTGERLGVCDVFGRQELNVDRSGEGSLDLFRRNLRAHTRPADVVIHAKRSELLSDGDTTTSCRLFHIDGGHLPEVVQADMRTAVRALHEEGVVIVDDIFNPSWPGVAEGFFAFMTGEPVLVPLLIGGNKVFLCRAAAAATYETEFSRLVDIAAIVPFTFERKSWLGREVMTAVRHHWVDLDPWRAAAAHASARNR